LLHRVELGLPVRQRWCELDDDVAAVVGAAVEAVVEQRAGEELLDQQLAFVGAKVSRVDLSLTSSMAQK
jgi:hypothetical protein